MKKSDLDKYNIENLTSLWKSMGLKANNKARTPHFFESSIWPRRYWIDWDKPLFKEEDLNFFFKNYPNGWTIPLWSTKNNSQQMLSQGLKEEGFEMIFTQKAMFLPLSHFQAAKKINLETLKINSKKDLLIWRNIASESFGYEIDLDVVHKIAMDPDISINLAYIDGKAIASGLLHKTQDVVGIHMIGVQSGNRGKGIAYSLMIDLLNIAKSWKAKYATVQASSLGEGIYRRLGFEEQFTIENYKKLQ